ncbi:hypothetical protein ACIOD1_11790 [Streptomyces sp. NPDC088097]|uniref:hypothetical protein n=1 Tax=Streptomyces sp. NPDC088097 TaxID=3365823 RepID=UPI00380B2644
MPRRRPGALRAERGTYDGRRPPAWARDLPPVDRLPPEASAYVHWVGRDEARRTVDLLYRYRAFLGTPGGRLLLTPSECPACPGCALDDVAVVRDELGGLHHSLPPRAATALGRVLRPLDAEFRRRTLPDPAPPPDDRPERQGLRDRRPWWRRRAYDDM